MSGGSGSRLRLGLQVGAAALLLALVFVWSEGLLTRKVGPSTPLEEARGEEYRGDTAPVVSRPLPVRVEALGTVRPVREAAVTARVPGVVRRVEVDAGDAVRKGQVLATLATPELQARSEAAVREREAAEAARSQARADYERIRRLHDKEAATEAEWEQARTALTVAEANAARARAAAQGEAAVASYASLRAPFDGVVLERLMDPGDLAGPERPVVRVGDISRYRLEASVPEDVGVRVHPGDVVGVRLDALDRRVEGKVVEVSPAADPASRTVLVKAELPSLEGLVTGQFGRMTIETGTRAALVVPQAAVRRVGGVELAQVVGPDGRARTRYVRTGDGAPGGNVEVLSGLEEGERVAVPGPAPAGHE